MGVRVARAIAWRVPSRRYIEQGRCKSTCDQTYHWHSQKGGKTALPHLRCANAYLNASTGDMSRRMLKPCKEAARVRRVMPLRPTMSTGTAGLAISRRQGVTLGATPYSLPDGRASTSAYAG
jgi:hypothetical protein